MKTYFEKNGLLTKCIIKDKNKTFTGFAKCLEEDKDFYSSFTGREIAFDKAYIKYLKYLLKKVRFEQKTLLDFYNSIKDCNRYDGSVYISMRLVEKIKNLSISINNLENDIMDVRYSLNEYIEGKDKIHNRIREMRKEK